MSPRSNRRRSEGPDDRFDRFVAGHRRGESRRGADWTVQPVPASRALKAYVCPGCSHTIDEGVAHVVVWRSDGILGDAADLAARRHWHDACWRVF